MKNAKKVTIIFLSILLLLSFAKVLRSNSFLKQTNFESNIRISQLIQHIKTENQQIVSAAVSRSPIPRGGIQANFEAEHSELAPDTPEDSDEDQSLPMFGESILGLLTIILGTLLLISSAIVRYLINRKFYLDLDGEDS